MYMTKVVLFFAPIIFYSFTTVIEGKASGLATAPDKENDDGKPYSRALPFKRMSMEGELAEDENGIPDSKDEKKFSVPPSFAMQSKSRRRRSFGYRSTCFPKFIKKCIIATYKGVTKPICVFVFKKEVCYALD